MADYPLVLLSEVRPEIDVAGTAKDPLLTQLILRASAIAEQYLDRQIITRGVQTEYHSFYFWGRSRCSELFLLDHPIISVTEVNEDQDRVYAAATQLVENTDFIVSQPSGKLIRISSLLPLSWANGFRSVKIRATTGYAADTTTVPLAIKDVVLKLVALSYREIIRQQQGVSAMSDAIGNVTRFGTAQLREEMKRQLDPWKRREFAQTGERDAA